MIKKILLSSTVIILLAGCSDKKEENEQTNKVNTVQTQAPLKIEVETNNNVKEIKVKEKAQTKKENETYYFNYNNTEAKYDENSKPANEDANVRVKPRTNIDANLHVRSPYEKVKISLLVKQLSKEFIVKCSACHNDYANGIIGPSLLQKDSDSIYKSIMKFKKNKDANVLMTGLVNQMSEKEIKKLADEIYDFNKQIRELK
jgi:cytochrome c553